MFFATGVKLGSTDIYNSAVRAVVCENPRQLFRCCAASDDERCVTKVVPCCVYTTTRRGEFKNTIGLRGQVCVCEDFVDFVFAVDNH